MDSRTPGTAADCDRRESVGGFRGGEGDAGRRLGLGTGCRQAVFQAPAGIIRGGMAEDVDRWLGGPDGRDGCDRRNGTRRRCLPCKPGDIGLAVPQLPPPPHRRARELCAPRAGINLIIPVGFVPGLSARRIGGILPPCSGAGSRSSPSAASPRSSTLLNRADAGAPRSLRRRKYRCGKTA